MTTKTPKTTIRASKRQGAAELIAIAEAAEVMPLGIRALYARMGQDIITALAKGRAPNAPQPATRMPWIGGAR